MGLAGWTASIKSVRVGHGAGLVVMVYCLQWGRGVVVPLTNTGTKAQGGPSKPFSIRRYNQSCSLRVVDFDDAIFFVLRVLLDRFKLETASSW